MMTIRRPIFPADQPPTIARRSFLAGTAALSVASTPVAPAVAAPNADPVMAMLDRHRAAWATYSDLTTIAADMKDADPECQRLRSLGSDSMHEADDLLLDLLEVEPTTIAGVAAMLAYATDWIANRNGSWPSIHDDAALGHHPLLRDIDPVCDTDHWSVIFHANLARALGKLARLGGQS